MAGKAMRNLELSRPFEPGLSLESLKNWLSRRIQGEEGLEAPRLEMNPPENPERPKE